MLICKVKGKLVLQSKTKLDGLVLLFYKRFTRIGPTKVKTT